MTVDELVAMIETAFAGVTLEDGVGLYESQALDDYLSEEVQAEWRVRDEKDDWHKIKIYDLYVCGTCMHYFDPKGMRFHLPQILLHALGVYNDEEDRLHEAGLLKSLDCPDAQWNLTYLDGFDRYYSALNADQIACVIAYLEYVRDNAEALYEIIVAKSIMHEDLEDIERALPVWRARKAELEAT